MKLVDFVSRDQIRPDLEATTKMGVLSELGTALAEICANATEEEITGILVDRERLATTGVGDGVAIPHGKMKRLDGIRAAVGISRTGVPFDAVDAKPVHIFVALLAPVDSTGDHLKALARMSRILKEPDFRQRLLGSRTADEIYSSLVEEDAKY